METVNRGISIAESQKYAPIVAPVKRMTRLRMTGVLAALLAVVAVGCGGDGENDAILVLAAASMTDALVEAGEAYESGTGIDVTFSFGGSNALARQVEFGAPADAVIFAGASVMEQLEESGELVASSRVDLLRNRLVVIGGKGAVLLESLAELESSGGRIAIADPALAPAGLYAKQSLESAGLWDVLESRVIPTLDVRAAVGAVGSGGVAFGVVYATDAAVNAGVEVLLIVSEQHHDPIVYPAALVDGSDNENAAAKFLQFLGTRESSEIFERHGFQVADR